MKRVLLSAAVVIAAVAGVTCYNHESENEMSDLAKANAKALADTNIEDIITFCVWHEFQVCQYYVMDQNGNVEGYEWTNMYQRFYDR